jgi:thiamine biosynthesis lipoprotein
MEIDFGGLGKEYAADRIGDLWRQRGLAGLINLGGDIVATGSRPGGPWTIGIQHPRRPAELAATVELDEGAIATSGDYQRFMVLDGRRYCHIFDPRTGWPANELASVSVLAPNCLIAGTLATSAMLMGDFAANWLNQQGVRHLILPKTAE